MTLYHKISRYSIFIAIAMAAIFLFNVPVRADNFTLEYNSLFNLFINNSSYADTTGLIDSVYYDSGTSSVINFNTTFTTNFCKEPYTSALYADGHIYADVRIPVTVPAGLTSLGFSYDLDIDTNNEFCHITVPICYYNREIGCIVARVFCYFSNLYLEQARDYFAVATFNCSFSFRLPNDYVNNSLRLSFGTPTASSMGFDVSTSVTPRTTSGLAGIISHSVLAGIGDSNIEEFLEIANTNLNTNNTWLGNINYVLTSIKAQDLSLYNQIISSIVSQTQNDNALQQAFINFLTQQLHGSATYGLDSNMSLHIEGPIGDIVSHIWYQVIDFKTKFQQFVAANQSEAAEVNSEASSQEDELNILESQLAIPSANVDSPLTDLDIMAGSHTYDGSNFFYFLENAFVLKIVVMVVSLGLVGFILYGRG